MTPYQEARTRQGARIALFGVEPQDDGTVLALGAHSVSPLRAGRVLVLDDGHAYKLTTPLPAGLALVGGPRGHERDTLITLEPKKGRA